MEAYLNSISVLCKFSSFTRMINTFLESNHAEFKKRRRLLTMANINKKIRIVADCDEVLTFIAPVWWAMLCKNKEYFGEFLNIDNDFNLKRDFCKILARPEFLLDKCFLKEEYKETGIPEEVREDFYNKYYSFIDYDDFYLQFCRPSLMAKGLNQLVETSYVNELHIVTRCLPHNHKGKTAFLKLLFGDNMKKTEIHILDLKEKKSDVINKLGKVDAVFEDELSNVNDIIEHCNPQMDIHIPSLGYNRPTKELYDFATRYEKNIEYYSIYDVSESNHKKEVVRNLG